MSPRGDARVRGSLARSAATAGTALEENEIVGAGGRSALDIDALGDKAARLVDSFCGHVRVLGASSGSR